MSNILEERKKNEKLKKYIKYVACYIRVSTDEQVKFGFSIQAQKDALEKYCKEHGYKCEFFIDEGISASSMKRPALQKMLSKISIFDMVLFTKLDRLSRNVLDANNINKILKDNNCTMKAIDEDDVDTTTADGTFIFNLKVSLAQGEIGKTSERIKFVFKNKREKGEITSGTKKYGYDIVDRRYKINPSEAKNIINLYEYFISVNGDMKKTYKYFSNNFQKGQDALYSYLRETAYIGKYKLYRKNEYLENYIPAIMDEKLWNNVQSLLKRKTINRINVDDIFSGLIYCYQCKNRMCKKVDHRTKNKTIRYVCDYNYRYKPGTDIRKCSNIGTIREDYIEKYLLNNLEKEFKQFKLNNKIIKETKTKPDISEINKIKNKINKLKDLYLDDLIDKDTYIKDYHKFEEQLNNLTNNIVIEEKCNFSNVEKILNSDYLTLYNSLSKNNKKRFLHTFIDKIYILNGEIKEVTFL